MSKRSTAESEMARPAAKTRIALADLTGEAGPLFRRLASHSHGLFLKLSGQDEVTAPQLTLLAALQRDGPMPQAELGRRAGIDKNTLAEMLRRMEARCLLARSPLETDRRSIQVTITEGGLDCVDRLAPAAIAVGEILLEPLTKEQREMFMILLNRLATPLNRAANGETAPPTRTTESGRRPRGSNS